MKLFTCGPVQMYPTTASIRSKGFIYFRTPEYGSLVKSTLIKLSEFLGNPEENSLIYLAASGTGAMEATVENCVNQQDKALVINGGGFGKRFCELLKFHNIPFDSINLKWNEQLTQEHLTSYDNKDYTILFVNIHETSTGQLYDIDILSKFCKRNNMYLIVDAISSFLADRYNMGKYGIDATIVSSQKGLCCSPGLSLVSLSKRMIKKINNNERTASIYFDFKDYLKNITRGQTPYTPPALVMYEIQDMLNIIEQTGGLSYWLDNIKTKAQYFRKKANEMGLKIPSYKISNMLTPLIFDKLEAYEIFKLLKDKYQIYVTPSGGDLANKLLRVSHIGNTTMEDIDDLLEKLMISIDEVKLNKEKNV